MKAHRRGCGGGLLALVCVAALALAPERAGAQQQQPAAGGRGAGADAGAGGTASLTGGGDVPMDGGGGDEYDASDGIFGSDFGVDPREDKVQGAAALRFALDCVFTDSDDTCRDELLAVHELVEQMMHEPTRLMEIALLGNGTAGAHPGDAAVGQKVTPKTLDGLCVSGPRGRGSGCLHTLQKRMLDMFDHFNGTYTNSTTPAMCAAGSAGFQVGQGAYSAVGLIGMMIDFICLSNSEGERCPYAIANALEVSGLDEMLDGKKLQFVDIGMVCFGFYQAGCCAQSFFNLIQSVYQMSCVTMSQTLSSTLRNLPRDCLLPVGFGGIGAQLPPKCANFPSMSYGPFRPKTCPDASEASMWEEIKESEQCSNFATAGTCPSNLCGMACMAEYVLKGLMPHRNKPMDDSPPSGNDGFVHGDGDDEKSLSFQSFQQYFVPGLGVFLCAFFLVFYRHEILSYGGNRRAWANDEVFRQVLYGTLSSGHDDNSVELGNPAALDRTSRFGRSGVEQPRVPSKAPIAKEESDAGSFNGDSGRTVVQSKRRKSSGSVNGEPDTGSPLALSPRDGGCILT